jgi:predicted nucleic acid-binding protein
LVRDDRNHRLAMSAYPAVKDRDKTTTSLVVSETHTWLRHHVGFSAAIAFWERMLEDEEKGRITLLRPDRGLEERALILARRYTDVSLSLTDALSLAVLQEHRIREVFGFDRHFFLAGCRLLPLSADA